LLTVDGGEKAEANRRDRGEVLWLAFLSFGMRERASAMRIYDAELVALTRNLHAATGNYF
jgi:hypothetical protein